MSREENNQVKLEKLQDLLSTYEGALLRYVSRLIGNPSSAEDIVQNTFIKLIRNWADTMERFPSIGNWLYKVAHNEALDYVRSESRRKKLHDEHGAECISNGAATDNPEISERAENAAAALARLSERERQLVILKVYEEKSYREIAEITGLTTGNVGFILHGAMKKLASMLTKGGKL